MEAYFQSSARTVHTLAYFFDVWNNFSIVISAACTYPVFISFFNNNKSNLI